MILSSKTTLKFTNQSKLDDIHNFIYEYKKVVMFFVDTIWSMDKIPSLLPNEITSQVSTWLTARAIQCAGKQASGIVRGTQTKQKRRLFVINQLKTQKKIKKARKLLKIYNEIKQSKPNINNIQCELDERFVDMDWNNKTTFDGWINLTCLGNKLKFNIPVKKHEHFNKMLKKELEFLRIILLLCLISLI